MSSPNFDGIEATQTRPGARSCFFSSFIWLLLRKAMHLALCAVLLGKDSLFNSGRAFAVRFYKPYFGVSALKRGLHICTVTMPANASKSDLNKPGYKSIAGSTALVTGSSGLCGARLVEMLLERGAKTVICFDLAEPSGTLKERFEAVQRSTNGTLIFCSGADGDLTSDEAVKAAFAKAGSTKIDCVYHIGALVGPFFDRDKYYGVNYYGTLRIIENCRKNKVPKLV